MKKTVLLSLFLASALLSGQPPTPPEALPVGVRSRDLGLPGQPTPAERIAERLKLDAAKTGQLVKIYDQMMLDMAKLRIQMDRKQLDLKELLLSGNLEMDKIRKNCDERGKIIADMQYLAFIADNDVKKLLTPEQWSHYVQIKTVLMQGGGPKPSRDERDGKADAKSRK